MQNSGSPNTAISAVGGALGEVEQIMTMSLDSAAEVFRAAMRETVKRYSLWYLIQGALLVVAGFLAIIYPILSSVAVIIIDRKSVV